MLTQAIKTGVFRSRSSDYDMVWTHRLFRCSKTESGLKQHASTLIILVLKCKIIFWEFEKFEQTNGSDARCGLRKVADYARATSAAAVAAAAVAAFVCSVLYGSHAKAVNLRHRGELCSACVGRAVRCACGAVTHPRAQITTSFSGDRSRLHQKKRQHTEHPRQHAAAVCSRRTRQCHRCCICTLRTLRRMTFPAFAAASRWHGLATRAMPLVRQ